MKVYEHHQWALFPVVVVVAVIVAAVAYAGPGAAPIQALFFVLLIVLVLAAFARLTTRVDDSGVRWAYTLGIPCGSLLFNEIERVEPVRTNIFEGWGIHWTPWHGWLWNVSGFDAVQFFLRDGRRLAVGTDDSAAFIEAINARLALS